MAEPNPYKRPASPVVELPMPPAKIAKTTNQLQINYLKREKKETIPLVTTEEPLPRLLRLMGEYDGVLQRHESLAGNLGACPVGPILLKRFERLFEGPPRILKSNSRDPNITWLDVVEFAQNKPEQFDLEKTRNGIRVCQFYLKQCRVEISEEDYVLIRSGMPQKLIPPQPILEDEEKELGVIDVLDRNLGKVIASADQVSARARQLVHRLKNRRTAILARRESEGDTSRNLLRSNDLPTSPAGIFNGALSQPVFLQTPPQSYTLLPSQFQPQPQSQPQVQAHPQPQQQPQPQAHSQPQPQPQPQPQSQHPSQHVHQTTLPPMQTVQSPSMGGFTAVNLRHSLPAQEHHGFQPVNREIQNEQHNRSLNGTPTASHTPHPERQPERERQEDWMNKFLTPDERAAGLTAETVRRTGSTTIKTTPSREDIHMTDEPLRSSVSRRPDSRRQSDNLLPESTILDVQTPTVPIPSTPASLIPIQKPSMWNRDDGGPHKAEMISRMETMKRGERVIPPCDRCRRLHMDCIKNLTACLGCTKKHAKCAWKDVTQDELESTAPAARERAEKIAENAAPSSSEWDNILRTNNQDLDMDKASSSNVDQHDMSMELHSPRSTPRMQSPAAGPPPLEAQRSASVEKPPSRGPVSPQLDLRPPPYDPQHLRDVANTLPKHEYSNHPVSNRSRTEEPTLEDSDRLAAVAAQVYRTASQNAGRPSEM